MVWLNERTQLIISLAVNGFHDFEKRFFSQIKNVFLNFAFILFLSTLYLISLMTVQISHYLCSKTAQSKMFWVAKYGFTASTTFSQKFYLKLVGCLFVVPLVTT